MNKKILAIVIGVLVVAVLGGLVYYFQGGNLQGFMKFQKGGPVTSPIGNKEVKTGLPAGAGKIVKTEIPTCGNSGGEDGTYSACVNDTITHNPSSVKATLLAYHDDYAIFSLSGAKEKFVGLMLNKPKAIISSYFSTIYGAERELILTYIKHEDKFGAFVKIESTGCANSSGGDGLYSVCEGDTVSHDSGISMTVASYDDNYVTLIINGTENENATGIAMGQSRTLRLNNIPRLKITYTRYNLQFGAFLKLESL